jgi:hypothetical protein
MALTQGIRLLRIGDPGLHEPIAAPLTATVSVYPGTFALSRAGYLVNAASPQSTDVVLGLIDQATGGTFCQTGAAITGGTTNTSVWVDCATGTFLLASGTGADTVAEANVGATVYVIDEQSVGLTNGSNTRPAAGVVLPFDPTIPSGFVPVKLTNPAS